MLKELIPVRIKDAIKILCGTAVAVPESETTSFRVCPVCRQSTEFRPLPYSYLRELLGHGFSYPLFETETMNFDEYSCAKCGAIDRERLFSLYFDREWRGAGSILEIAPHLAMTNYFRSLPGSSVRTADLYDPSADDRVDITKMSIYKDGQFDAWVCSHVLEHIPDDRQAIRELFRILKAGGWGIAMVPISLAVEETHEDPSITEAALRWKYFGQDDHVRMYAKQDFVQRFQDAGFTVDQVQGHSFGQSDCERAGVDPKSVLYVVRKPK
jgi:SAM-dependent methyltransferase